MFSDEDKMGEKKMHTLQKWKKMWARVVHCFGPQNFWEEYCYKMQEGVSVNDNVNREVSKDKNEFSY